MTYPTAPKIVPSSIEKRRNEASFTAISLGHSFQQRIGIGIGQDPISWDIRWDYITSAQAGEWRSFFQKQQGYKPFHILLEDEIDPYLVYCDYWQETSLGRGFWHISARLTTA